MGRQRTINVQDGVVVGITPPTPRVPAMDERSYNKGYANGKQEALEQLTKAFTFVGVPIVNPTGIGDAVQQAVNLLRNERIVCEALPGEDLSDARLLTILEERLQSGHDARRIAAEANARVAKLKEVLGG